MINRLMYGLGLISGIFVILIFMMIYVIEKLNKIIEKKEEEINNARKID